MLKSGLAEERREEDGLWCVVLVYQDTQTVFNLYFECFKSFTSCLHFLLIKQITKQLQQIRKFSILMVGLQKVGTTRVISVNHRWRVSTQISCDAV